MVARKNDINVLKIKILAVLKKYKIKKAGLFGSYALGNQKKNSDVDILVDTSNKNMSLLGFVHIKNELEDSLEKRVDLVEYKMVRPEIKEEILNSEVRII